MEESYQIVNNLGCAEGETELREETQKVTGLSLISGAHPAKPTSLAAHRLSDPGWHGDETGGPGWRGDRTGGGGAGWHGNETGGP